MTLSAVEYVVDPLTSCWIWQRSKNDGYGQKRDRGKVRRAHVVYYEAKYGPVPEGLVLDHFVCDNRACVNPDHVRPTTTLENVRRRKARPGGVRPAACPRGHPLEGDNVIYRADGRRMCRTCRGAWKERAKTTPPAPKVDVCRRGHPLSGENEKRRGDGRRQCRICLNAARQRRRQVTDRRMA